jgi:hypothetical protein
MNYGMATLNAIRLNTSDVEILKVGKRLEVLKARHSNLAAGHFVFREPLKLL